MCAKNYTECFLCLIFLNLYSRLYRWVNWGSEVLLTCGRPPSQKMAKVSIKNPSESKGLRLCSLCTTAYCGDQSTSACSPNLAHCLVPYFPRPKNDYYTFKWLGKPKEEHLATWRLYEIQILVSISRVLLRHSHTHSFTYGLKLFHCNSRVEELWQRPYGLQSRKCYLDLCRKSLLNPWLHRSLVEKEAGLSPCLNSGGFWSSVLLSQPLPQQLREICRESQMSISMMAAFELFSALLSRVFEAWDV